jgi:hypothetical protein
MGNEDGIDDECSFRGKEINFFLMTRTFVHCAFILSSEPLGTTLLQELHRSKLMLVKSQGST